MAEYKKKNKYNLMEVRITRCVIGMFLYALMWLGVWGARRLHLIVAKEMGVHFVIFALTGIVWLGAAVCIWLYYRRKKAGESFGHRVWGVEFVTMLTVSFALALSVLAISFPPEMWGYTAPVAYTLVAILYVLYVLGWDQGDSFRHFGIMCAAAGVGEMLMLQTYYKRQVFLQPVFRFVERDTAFVIGWVVMGVIALFLILHGKKTKTSFWKQMSVVVLFAIYWVVLSKLPKSAELVTAVGGGVLALWFVILRILKAIRVVK